MTSADDATTELATAPPSTAPPSIEETPARDDDDAPPPPPPLAEKSVGAEKRPRDDDDDDDDDDAKRAKPTGKPVTLGPMTFASGDAIMEYFGRLRNELTLDQNMNEYEARTTEALLRLGHEEAERKIGCGIRNFQIRKHPAHGTRCFMIVREDNTMEDFSYRKCAVRLFPGYDPASFRGNDGARAQFGGRGGGR